VKRIEWCGTTLQAAGAVMLASNTIVSPWAYPVMLPGALLWCYAAARQRAMAALALHGVFTVINLVGLWRWVM
jgi:hypothetical protein